MKTFCFECKHDCHCGRKCDQCSCYICNNIVIKTYEDYMGGNMIKKPQSKMCDLCGHKLSHHVHEGINKCAHCDCSLSQAPGNKWWEKVISWLT